MIDTREFAEGDEGAFLVLYRECLVHYHVPPATPEQEARVLAILASGRHMSCLMAWRDDRPLGFATWALTLPAAAGTALYMKELFVSPAARGRGVGRALLAGLIRIAETERCVRLDWQTDGGNITAQAFYKSIGAPAFDKKTFRIAAPDYRRFLDSLG